MLMMMMHSKFEDPKVMPLALELPASFNEIFRLHSQAPSVWQMMRNVRHV